MSTLNQEESFILLGLKFLIMETEDNLKNGLSSQIKYRKYKLERTKKIQNDIFNKKIIISFSKANTLNVLDKEINLILQGLDLLILEIEENRENGLITKDKDRKNKIELIQKLQKDIIDKKIFINYQEN